MRTRTLAAVAALTLVSLARPAAAQQPATAPAVAPAPAPLPSVTLPPALDRVLRDYERGWRAGDAAAVAALFAPDGFVLQSGQPPVRGRAAIEAAYAGQGGPLHLRALAFAESDSVAWIIGAYGYAAAGAAPAAAVPDMGKFTLTLRRGAGGRWLIFSDMDNTSQRPRRMPSSAGTPPAP